jgi:hypothetical protein
MNTEKVRYIPIVPHETMIPLLKSKGFGKDKINEILNKQKKLTKDTFYPDAELLDDGWQHLL